MGGGTQERYMALFKDKVWVYYASFLSPHTCWRINADCIT